MLVCIWFVNSTLTTTNTCLTQKIITLARSMKITKCFYPTVDSGKNWLLNVSRLVLKCMGLKNPTHLKHPFLIMSWFKNRITMLVNALDVGCFVLKMVSWSMQMPIVQQISLENLQVKQKLTLNLEQLYRGFVNKPVRVKFDTLLNSSAKAPSITTLTV